MRVTVIGAAGIDVFVKSKNAIEPGESNPADISLRAAGKARNIASMLARRGVDVHLITAAGNDPLGVLLKESCEEIGINTGAWIIKNHMHTNTCLNTLEPDGNLFANFNTLTITESIKTNDILKHKNIISEAELLIADLNITEKILSAVMELREGKPVLVDGVSAEKAKRVENCLDKVTVLKLNRRQAECLTGISLDTKERVKHACFSLADKGAGRVFITLGVAGACASDEDSTIFVPAQPVAVKDISGAGAAFVTGLAMGIDMDMRSQAEQAVAFAAEHLKAYAKRKD